MLRPRARTKKPEIKYRRAPEDIDALAALQREIIANASRCVAPGGALVYCVCTLSPRESDGVADWFLKNFPFTMTGREELLPHLTDTDGFYIAKFIRARR